MVSLEDTNTSFNIFSNTVLEEVCFVLERDDLLHPQKRIFNSIEIRLAKLMQHEKNRCRSFEVNCLVVTSESAILARELSLLTAESS